jgi:tetratricopeptide (TPR) repeat protein
MIALFAVPLAAAAAGGGGGGGSSEPAVPADPVVAAVQAAVARKDFTQAAAAAREGLAKSPQNADYHNLYAYAVRKGSDPNLDVAFKHYHEALRLDPKHRGAHEYIGEAYLMVGNVGKAKEHLARLDGLCFFGCEEYSALKKAVADYEAKGKR